MPQPPPNPLLNPRAMALIGLFGSPVCLLATWFVTADARADPLFGLLITRVALTATKVICGVDLLFAGLLLWPPALRAVRRWTD